MDGQNPGVPVNFTSVPKCNFTWCFCCRCGYEAKCVHMFSFILDALVFGVPCIHALTNIGNEVYGWGRFLFLVIGLAFLGMTTLAIMHIVKTSEYMANNELPERTAVYLSRRNIAIWAYFGFGVVIAIIIIIILTSVAGALGFIVAAMGGIMILIQFGITTGIMFGYKASFKDSAEAMAGRPIGSAPTAGAAGANVSLISMHQEQAKPTQYHGGPPVLVSGPPTGQVATKKAEPAPGTKSITMSKGPSNGPTPGPAQPVQQAAAPKKAGVTRANRS